ncbi:hypothetical protein FYJ79_01020 [Sharpea azabuensis]|uniref:O-antigen ligase-related domain-containing protein n=1 Tax=Sharpea porci TaxID=2652286 RepID=A0A844FS03_9FIRM|nr:O-antigen ligase family protein [Sharpea porci]MST88189.1 hypothetical protein [Sharpea porci]
MKINRINFNKLFWIIYFVMIALPLHASNKLISYVSITGMVSIFHVLLGGMLIYAIAAAIKSHKISIEKNSFLVYLFGITLIVALIHGIENHPGNINAVIGDFSMYFLSYAIFSIINSRIFESVDLRWFFKITFYAMTICLTINILMYATSGFSFWGVSTFGGGRFGGGYVSLIVVTVLYGVYDFLYEKTINTKILIYHIVLAIISSLLAQSRTHIILCAVGCILLLIPFWKKISSAIVLKVFIVVVIGIIGSMIFLKGDSNLAQRLLNMDITSNTETTESRMITWIFYWNRIKQNPVGTGFGETMYNINPSMTYALDTATYNVDNAFAVVMYKGGWIFGFLYFMLIFRAVYRDIIQLKRSGDKFYALVAILLLMMVVSTMIMTSQVIHTYAINTFMWTLLGLNNRNTRRRVY